MASRARVLNRRCSVTKDYSATTVRQLVSPGWLETYGPRAWVVIRFGIRSRPRWKGVRAEARGWWFFREVLFLNEDREVRGIGRMWTPVSLGVLRILIRLLPPRARLLGSVVKEFGSVRVRSLLEEREPHGYSAQYWHRSRSVVRTCRTVKVQWRGQRFSFVTEEVFR